MTLPEQKMKLNLHISKQCDLWRFLQKPFWSFKIRIPQDALKSCWAEQSLTFFFFFLMFHREDKIMLFVILKSLPTSSLYTRVHTTRLAVMPLLKTITPVVSSSLPSVRWAYTTEDAHWLWRQSLQSPKHPRQPKPGLSGEFRGKKVNQKTPQNNKVWFFITAMLWISAPTHFSQLQVHPELTHLGINKLK